MLIYPVFALSGFVLLRWFFNAQVERPEALQSNSRDNVLTGDLIAYIERVRADAHIPGLTVGIVRSDGYTESHAWGVKDEEGTEMSVETRFIMASCSKAFAAASLGILMDDFAQGKNKTSLPASFPSPFDWGSKMTDLLPDDWAVMDEWTSEKATVKDILTHMSGLPRHDYAISTEQSPLQATRLLRHLRPAYELREHWAYNNLMYVAASHLVSRYTGMPYIDFVKERIFGPLNMSSSTYSPSEASLPGNSTLTQFWAYFGRRIPPWLTDATRDSTAGPGGVISNVMDLMKWMRIYLNKGVDLSTNTTVIPAPVLEDITTSYAIVTGRSVSRHTSIGGYGMGWFRHSYKGHEIISHDGGLPGISTVTAFLPTVDLGVAILANSDAKNDVLDQLVGRIMEVTLKMDAQSFEPMGMPVLPIRTPAFKLAPEPLTLDLEKYAGPYSDPGYGELMLCSWASDTSHCQQVLHDFAPFDSPQSDATMLYAVHSSVVSTHLRLRYISSDFFRLEYTYLFPNGYGRDTSPFEWQDPRQDYLVEFVLTSEGTAVSGFAVLGETAKAFDWVGRGLRVQDVAEVWFERH